MIQTLKDIERTLDENDARRKRRGHNGLTIDDLEAINLMKENGEALAREDELKRRRSGRSDQA